jgi:DNA-binding NtrC family response regulator
MKSFPCERVLVVDDSSDMLASMRDVLELEGTVVATATSRDDAEAVLSDGFEPNVIMIDVHLASGERGEEYARSLRGTHPRCRLVLMSGDVRELRRREGDADATLAKPFHIERLIKVLSNVARVSGRD